MNRHVPTLDWPRSKRMEGEIEIDRAQIRGSWLRLIGVFTWKPNHGGTDVPTGAVYNMIRVGSGTCYHAETPIKVIEIIESYMGGKTRLRFHWGNAETGEDWCDTFSVEGIVSRSLGMLASPLLCYNARSDGGFPILDNCTVRIRFANRKSGGDLYRHPNYHVDLDQFRAGMSSEEAAGALFARHFA